MTDPVVIQVALAPRVLKAQFAAATGLTVKAIERKGGPLRRLAPSVEGWGG